MPLFVHPLLLFPRWSVAPVHLFGHRLLLPSPPSVVGKRDRAILVAVFLVCVALGLVHVRRAPTRPRLSSPMAAEVDAQVDAAAEDDAAPADQLEAGLALLAAAGDPFAEQIKELEERQRGLRKQRQDIMRRLKNESRKKRRIMAKARWLSDADIIQVVRSRAMCANARAKAKAAP